MRQRSRVEVNSKSCGVSVAIDNADHVFSNAIKFEEIVIYECHVQRLQSQFRDGSIAEEESAERHQGPDRESVEDSPKLSRRHCIS